MNANQTNFGGHTNAQNNNINNGRMTEEDTMKLSTVISMIIAMVALFALGCDDSLSGEKPTETLFTVDMQYTDDCLESESVPEFCNTAITVPVSFKEGLNDEGGRELTKASLSIARESDNTGHASVQIPAHVWNDAEYITAYLNYDALKDYENYQVQLCGGGDPATVELVEDTNVCLSIVRRGFSDKIDKVEDKIDDIGDQIDDIDSDIGDIIDAIGSGTGTVTLKVDGHSGCLYDFGSDYLDNVCITNNDGSVCSNVGIGSYQLEISCDNGTFVSTGAEFTVVEDTETSYTFKVEELGSDTDDIVDVIITQLNTRPICISVQTMVGGPVNNAVIDFLQISDDPQVSIGPDGCNEPGDYYYEEMPQGTLTFVVSSDQGAANGTVEAGDDYQHVWITVQTPFVQGDLCYGKLGEGIDIDSPVVNLSIRIGYGNAEGACTPATEEQLAEMTASSSDEAISIEGLSVSLTNGFDGYTAGEYRDFDVEVSDGNSSVTVRIRALNDYFQDQAE